MKRKLFITAILTSFFIGTQAQDRTTVTATNTDISDNLDLRAVSSLFGESRNLNDFERKLNDPDIQISNLDLNQDNQVDYLRVIESVEGRTHLIIIQSVIGRDVFQDVATIEVEKDRNNNVQIQVVGDSYMYGHNYIYEPVFVHSPYIYNTFWVTSYRPYYSPWYWNYYPNYYYAWHPCSIYRYRNNINVYVVNNHYNYVNYRRSQRAIAMHNGIRANGYEAMHPNRSFRHRNSNVANSYELEQTRTPGTRTQVASSGVRNTSSGVRNTNVGTPRPTSATHSGVKATSGGIRTQSLTNTGSPRPSVTTIPKTSGIRTAPAVESADISTSAPVMDTPRQNLQPVRNETPRSSSINNVRSHSGTRSSNIQSAPVRHNFNANPGRTSTSQGQRTRR